MPPITKAVILARGLGTRMRAADETAKLDAAQHATAARGLKAMIPIGRPFLDYVLSALANAGYRDICLVIGPEHTQVREYYDHTAPPRRVNIHYAVQPQPRGTADAVLAAENFAEADEFLVLNSDNFYPVDCLRALRELDGPGLAAFDAGALVRESNISEERLRSYAVLRLDAGGFLADIVEKPEAIASAALISMNLWRFPPAIFAACRAVPLSARGEFELPRAVRDAIVSGMRLKAVRCSAGVLDLSRRADIAMVASHLRGVAAEP